MAGRKLTERQQAFVDYYCAVGTPTYENGTQAAIAAGTKAEIAARQAYKWLRSADISAAIETRLADQRAKVAEIVAERQGTLDLSAERWLKEVSRLCYFDPMNMLNSDGSPRQVADIDADTRAAISQLEIHELFDGTGDQKHAYGLSRKIGWTDKVRALKMMGDYLGTTVKKVEVSGKDGGPVVFRFERIAGGKS